MVALRMGREGLQKDMRKLWDVCAHYINCDGFTGIYVCQNISNFKSELKTCSYKNLYINVHSSIIHNNQKIEATQMSVNL